MGDSIDGGWLGTYYYGGEDSYRDPVRFEATFTTLLGGKLIGIILDDCRLGEADVSGEQMARAIQFTKIYRGLPKYSESGPVEYRGVLSEDAQSIQGHWTLQFRSRYSRRKVKLHGSWEARRMWDANCAEHSEPTVAVAAGELVGAVR